MSEEEFFRPRSSQILSENWGRLSRHEYDLRRRDGSWQHQIREVYDRGHGAVCLLHNPETDCVLLTRQFRLPVHVSGGPSFLIEAPAGLLEGAEPAERIRAELIEETGYQVSELEHLFDAYMSPGSVTEYLAFFIGSYSPAQRVSDGGGEEGEGEDIEVLHVPLPEALAMIGRGEIRDAKTIMLLQHLALRQARMGAEQ